MGQIVQGGDDRPAVHLPLIDLLGAVIQARGVAQADGVGGREQPEIGIGPDHPVLVQQGQLAAGFQHPLDDEHHVRAAGVIFVEHQGDGALQGPGQDALAKLGDLFAFLQDDGVLADQVDPRHVAVQIDPHQGPVQPGGDLLDMGRLAGAVIALDHHAAVIGQAGADGQGGLGIKLIGRVEIGHMAVAGREGRNLHVGVDAKGVAHRDHLVGRGGDQGIRFGQAGHTQPIRRLAGACKPVRCGQIAFGAWKIYASLALRKVA